MCVKQETIYQGSQSRTGGCIGLAGGIIYFGTGQYQCTVLDLPLFIYIYICMYVCVCVYYNKYESLP